MCAYSMKQKLVSVRSHFSCLLVLKSIVLIFLTISRVLDKAKHKAVKSEQDFFKLLLFW